MKFIFRYVFLCSVLLTVDMNALSADPVIIDEQDDSLVVTQSIEIDHVWSGHPVGFCLMTEGENQYVAYYNNNRNMVVGERNLNEDHFDLTTLPATSRGTHGSTTTVLGWDSHNSITLTLNSEGFIHLTGNMHASPLTYFRSSRPYDISSLEQVMNMVGSEEDLSTYPHFMKDNQGRLIFHYRDGGSGNGNEIYNIYTTETKTWNRLLDVPLTDGQGLMNAYQSQPTLMTGTVHVQNPGPIRVRCTSIRWNKGSRRPCPVRGELNIA